MCRGLLCYVCDNEVGYGYRLLFSIVSSCALQIVHFGALLFPTHNSLYFVVVHSLLIVNG